MPRTIRKTAESDLIDIPTRKAAVPPARGLGAAPAVPALVPDHIVQFLNALPMTGDSFEWNYAFRDALQKLLGDIDRVGLKINLNCNLIHPEHYRPGIEVSQHAGRESDTLLSTDSFETSWPSQQFIELARVSGTSFEEYHTPTTFDYYYKGTAYLGSIVLLRERRRTPISERTLDAMKALEPFIVFAMSDLVTRHNYSKPIDRVFGDIMREVAAEARLSTQDVRILTLMLMGLSYKQVADRMELSIDTIRKHTKRIYRKTRTGSLPELFAKYFTPRIGIEGLSEEESL